MQALISPNEAVLTGYRVAEVAAQPFDVAEPLFWVDCPDNITADSWFYDNGAFKESPQPESASPQVAKSQPTVDGAETL